MTTPYEKNLQDYISSQTKVKFNFSDENYQKSVIIGTEHGARITLYDWLHRDDSPQGEILDISQLDGTWEDAWLVEFKKLLGE